ncbi:MAG: right-handed parallel beta-helix repeat-containing protein, partial [Myxococcales bacterium]|nr:right-handed parallel beta-helix repeat-containing protein [Myxococcales bacterium]
DYARIALDMQAIGPDGWFLVAHPDGDAGLLALADLTSARVDLQNGPDSLQLRWRGRVVDAIGYGSFGATSTFAGEGTAIASGSPGQSATRDASHSDTDDNSIDFSFSSVPSPRANPSACTHECSADGVTRCSGDLVQTCGEYDADPCRDWSIAITCPMAGEVCAAGVCGPIACSDECAAAGERQCSGIQVQTCVSNYDSDPCLEWNAPAGCPGAGEECSGTGECSIPCVDECAASGDRRCAGLDYQSCGNHDTDSCLEWSTATACAGAGEQCTGAGVCSIPCTDECASGATRCSGTQTQTCGDYDADLCTEWSIATDCAAGETCSAGACRDASAPEVVLISPMGTIQSTQGATQRMLVDATAAPGRSIAAVTYYAGGVAVGMTTAAPHEFIYTVPASATTGSTLALQASAIDDAGSVGYSAFAYLDIRNDVPTASFTATITNVSTVTVDANGSSDTETALADLEICWDWGNDGTCDTAYSTAKIVSHDFGASGTFTIGMKVRDSAGQISATTRDVTFADIQYVGGISLMSTLWYGTVIVTGDVLVPTGETLTIAAGTDVLFVNADADMNGIGDYTLTVNGSLLVEGTALDPVVFSGQDMAGHTPGAWDGVVVSGAAPSTLSYAIVEYANIGLDIRNGSTLDNVIVRNTRDDCIRLNNADGATIVDSTTTLCGGDGVQIYGGSTGVTLTRHTSTENGDDGLDITSSSAATATDALLASNTATGARVGSSTRFDLSDSIIESNTAQGLLFASTSSGGVIHNQIRQNGREGVGLQSDAAGNPNPVIKINNIYSNAVSGSITSSRVSTTLSASHSCCSSAGATSATYTAPAGMEILRVRISYNETDSATNYVTGRIVNVSTGATIRSFSSDFNGWVYLPAGVTRVAVRVADSGYSSTTDTISLPELEVVGTDGSADVSAVTTAGTVDMQGNYLGTFPNVLSRVHMSRNTALNLQG